MEALKQELEELTKSTWSEPEEGVLCDLLPEPFVGMLPKIIAVAKAHGAMVTYYGYAEQVVVFKKELDK